MEHEKTISEEVEQRKDVNEIVIIGAGGHAKIVLDICLLLNRRVRGFIDSDKAIGTKIHGIPVLGNDNLLRDPEFVKLHSFFIGIGDPPTRKKLVDKVAHACGNFETLQHPAASISPHSAVGKGTLICAGSVVSIDAQIGQHCILNTKSSMDHDCVIKDNCQICPGATLAGSVYSEEDVYIGSGATINPLVRIGAGAVIGSGVTVTKDVAPGKVLIGIKPRVIDDLPKIHRLRQKLYNQAKS